MTVFNLLFDALLVVHVVAGFVGLTAFWIPVFARKGGRAHVRAGRVYAWCAYVVTLSAVVVAAGRIVSYRYMGIGVAEEPELYGFAVLLGYLGVVTFVMVRQGMRVLATRRAPEKLRTPVHEALAWASMSGSVIAVGFALAAWSEVSPVLLGMSPIGLFTGRCMLRLMRDPGGQRMGWFYSHLASMLGGGIAFHTAFIVFGAQRLWAYEIEGPLAVLPWLLPTVVGVPAIVIWTRRYRRKFERRAGLGGLRRLPGLTSGPTPRSHPSRPARPDQPSRIHMAESRSAIDKIPTRGSPRARAKPSRIRIR